MADHGGDAYASPAQEYKQGGDGKTAEMQPLRNSSTKVAQEKALAFQKLVTSDVSPDQLDEFEKEQAVLYGAVKAKSYYSDTMRPWEYAIRMPIYDENQKEAPATVNATKLLAALTRKFGQPNVRVKPHGQVDTKHCYIKITADKESLEKWAEMDKIKVRVNPWIGKGYRPYEIEEQRDSRAYRHAHCHCKTDDECFCCPYKAENAPCECLILVPYQRQEIVRERIVDCFDEAFDKKNGAGIKYALHKKIVKKVYPLQTLHHDNLLLDSYMSRRTALNKYCGWVSSIATVFAWSNWSREFSSYIRDYMGEKIGVYFAFLYYYTSWLMLLSVFGILLFVSQLFSSVDNFGVPLYCIVVAIWTTTFLEFWQRRNAELSHDWNMLDYENFETEMSTFVSEVDEKVPGFYEEHGAWVDMKPWLEKVGIPENGEEVKDFVDHSYRDHSGGCPSWCFCCFKDPENILETNTRIWRFIKEMFSLSVVLCMVGAVVIISLSLLVLRLIMQERLDNTVVGGAIAGVLQALVIAVLDFIFEGVAVALNNWENHRTATEYEDRLIAKQFFFQFINAYFSLYYIAFYKGGAFRTDSGTKTPKLFGYDDTCKNAAGHPTHSCVAELSSQLTAMMLTRLIIGNIIEWAVPRITLRFSIAKRIKDQREAMKKAQPQLTDEELDKKMAESGSVFKNVDAAEKQGFMPPYNLSQSVSGTFYDFSELAIQFGYVTLFAPAFPLAPVLAVISNIIENRNDGWKILMACQKPDYKGAQDIGTWFVIFRFLAAMAVITNMAMIGFTSNQLDSILDDPTDATKLWIVVALEHIIFGLQAFLAVVIPNQPRQVRIDVAEENEIQRVEYEFREYKQKMAEHKQWEEDHRRGLARIATIFDPSVQSERVQLPASPTGPLAVAASPSAMSVPQGAPNESRENLLAASAEPLPAPWQLGHDPAGNPYYYNPETNQSQWDRPSSL